MRHISLLVGTGVLVTTKRKVRVEEMQEFMIRFLYPIELAVFHNNP